MVNKNEARSAPPKRASPHPARYGRQAVCRHSYRRAFCHFAVCFSRTDWLSAPSLQPQCAPAAEQAAWGTVTSREHDLLPAVARWQRESTGRVDEKTIVKNHSPFTHTRGRDTLASVTFLGQKCGRIRAYLSNYGGNMRIYAEEWGLIDADTGTTGRFFTSGPKIPGESRQKFDGVFRNRFRAEGIMLSKDTRESDGKKYLAVRNVLPPTAADQPMSL